MYANRCQNVYDLCGVLCAGICINYSLSLSRQRSSYTRLRYCSSIVSFVRQMDTKVLDRILATDDKIRYAGILSNDFKSLESKAREDVKLLVDEKLIKIVAH